MKTSIFPAVAEGFHFWRYPKDGPALGRVRERREPSTPGWTAIETDVGTVYSDLSAEIQEWIAGLLGDFHAMLARGMGGPVPEAPYRVRVYASRHDFCRFAACRGAANAQSLYDPRTREMALWTDGREVGRDYFERTFAHETTHAYMDLVWRRTGPLWFAEGMAEYFASYEGPPSRAVPGRVMDELVRLALSEEPMPLAEFVRLPREVMYGPEFPRLYAIAWSVVHFFWARHPEVVEGLLKGASVPGPEEFDGEWRAYLAGL